MVGARGKRLAGGTDAITRVHLHAYIRRSRVLARAAHLGWAVLDGGRQPSGGTEAPCVPDTLGLREVADDEIGA